jgi:hypothetical protein
MQRTTLTFFVLYLWVVPASEAAAGQSSRSATLPAPLRGLVELEQNVPESIQQLRGHALADRLDELGRDPQTIEFFARCVEVVGNASLMDLAGGLPESEIRASVDPSLVARVDRMAALLDVAFEMVASELTRGADAEPRAPWKEMTLSAFAERLTLLDDRTRPVAERRLLRHSLRGMAALLCIAGRPGAIDLQRELLDHAIVGYESVLRVAAGSSTGPERARVIALGLEPVDRDAFERRAARLGAARAALDEARGFEPDFRLPPDPGFVEKSKD